MTIDKAISHEERNVEINKLIGEVSDCEPTNAIDYHRQLVEWLKELKRLREQTGWIPVSERLPRASEIVLLSLPEHTMVDGEECSPCVICGHYIGGKSEEWGISDGTTVGYGLVAYKHCKPIAWMPLPEPYQRGDENDNTN